MRALSALGFPKLGQARAVHWEPRRLEKLKEWKQEKRKRTPLALLHDPPAELRPRGPKRDFLERT